MKKRQNTIIILLLLSFLIATFAILKQKGKERNTVRRRICLKQMHIALNMYAMTNNGNFPTGQQTPEASLSLLYEDFLPFPDYLGGKSINPKVPKRILEKGMLLDPNSSSWTYIEGLTNSDSGDIAILWDKIPPVSGHGYCGKNPPDDSREVLYLDGHTNFIKSFDWNTFLKNQKELHKQKKQNKELHGTAEPLCDLEDKEKK